MDKTEDKGIIIVVAGKQQQQPQEADPAKRPQPQGE